jgi:hypothetical protein
MGVFLWVLFALPVIANTAIYAGGEFRHALDGVNQIAKGCHEWIGACVWQSPDDETFYGRTVVLVRPLIIAASWIGTALLLSMPLIGRFLHSNGATGKAEDERLSAVERELASFEAKLRVENAPSVLDTKVVRLENRQ